MVAIVAKQTTSTIVNLPETTDIPVSKEDVTYQQVIDGLNASLNWHPANTNPSNQSGCDSPYLQL
jgi:hypothetical protein